MPDGAARWLWVDDGSGPCPDVGRRPTRTAAAVGDRARVVAPWGRGGDDLYLLYTGGTTGMPKGVMWRQDDLFRSLDRRRQRRRPPTDPDLDAVARRACTKPGRVEPAGRAR